MKISIQLLKNATKKKADYRAEHKACSKLVDLNPVTLKILLYVKVANIHKERQRLRIEK
jgi:hypothetical protein